MALINQLSTGQLINVDSVWLLIWWNQKTVWHCLTLTLSVSHQWSLTDSVWVSNYILCSTINLSNIPLNTNWCGCGISLRFNECAGWEWWGWTWRTSRVLTPLSSQLVSCTHACMQPPGVAASSRTEVRGRGLGGGVTDDVFRFTTFMNI
jgi:hypothetical protein